MALVRIVSTAALTAFALFATRSGLASEIISGTDRKVVQTTIAADNKGEVVVVMWTSSDFSTGKTHLRLNRSADGGARWKRTTIDFAGNSGSQWHHDVMPDLILDSSGKLHLLWSRITDKEAPNYSSSPDYGDTWSDRVAIGGGTLPRHCGLALDVMKDNREIWAFCNDTNSKSYQCSSRDGGATWLVADEHTGDLAAGNPAKSFCSDMLSAGGHRYVLRRRNGKLNLLIHDGEEWSSTYPAALAGEISLAANHTVAADAGGRLFVVFGDAGKVHCLRSSDHGLSWERDAVVDPTAAAQTTPVIAVLEDGRVAVCWQDARGARPQIRYSISADGGDNWRASEAIAAADEDQSSPDILAAEKMLFFSFTEGGKAAFARLPKVPPTPPRIGAKPVLEVDFETFDGRLPTGWSFTSWNQEFIQETFGPTRPGRDGRGACFELRAGNPIAVLTVRSGKYPVTSNSEYVFKGFYAANGEVNIIARWLNDDNTELGEFIFKLPSTQDRWIEFFDDVSSPVGGRNVYLELSIHKKDTGGRLRFDDFSLRDGRIADYAEEFSLPKTGDSRQTFPIFGWMPPGIWPNFIRYGTKYLTEFDRDRYHAEYALAGFTVGYRAKFGLRRQVRVPEEDAELIAINNDPTVWAIHGGDEPRDDKFPKLAVISKRIKRLAPSKPYWNNLLPTYGFGSYEKYRAHVSNYIEQVEPSFLTYDHYALAGSPPRYGRDYFANLEIVRDECLRTGVDYGQIVDVCAFRSIRSPDEPELRWQALTSLAYGARALGWFTYLTEIDYGSYKWSDAVINRDGSRTRHYAMLKRLNHEVLALGRVLLKLKSTGVYHTAPLPELTTGVEQARLVARAAGGTFVVGEFADAGGTPHIMLVNRDFTADAVAQLVFRPKTKRIWEISKATGRKAPVDGFDPRSRAVTVSLPAGDGRLLMLEPE